jgi:hypothetical protein
MNSIDFWRNVFFFLHGFIFGCYLGNYLFSYLKGKTKDES